MLTSVRSLAAASLFAIAATLAAPAAAQVTNPADEVDDGGFDLALSANVALVSEYRFRGVDLSGGDIALQGGVDLGLPSGFYVGAWGSTLDDDTVGYGDMELDVFGGWTGDLGGLTADVGVIGYLYPDAGAGDYDYYEFYGSLGAGLGPASVTAGVAYAPSQDSLDFGAGSDDNLYLYLDAGVGIPTTPLTVKAHVGYTDGSLTYTDDGDAMDYSLGVEAVVPGTPITVGAAYVALDDDITAADVALGAYDLADDAIVLSVSATF